MKLGRFLLKLIGGLGLFGILVALGLLWWGVSDFEKGMNFSAHELPYSVIITDRNGVELHRSFDQENREWTDLASVPKYMRDLILLAEDRRFYDHFGVDLKSIVRAMKVNFEAGRVVQGASTLTQQIARKVFLSDERSFERKAREAFIAMGIEYQMGKDEILELYLNTAPFGPTTSGIRLASLEYFGKEPFDLTLAEAFILVALPQNPVRLTRKPNVRDWLGTCSDEILETMPKEKCNPFNEESGYDLSRIDALMLLYADKINMPKNQLENLWFEIAGTTLQKRENLAKTDYLHFQFFVKAWLKEKNIDVSDYPGGLRITTSLDTNLQQKVYTYARNSMGPDLLANRGADNFSIIVLGNKSRGPLVWIGSKAFWNEQIDGQVDILQSRRQPGSSIKPFVYAAAMAKGYEPNTILNDVPVKFGGESHVLQNADGLYMGWMGIPKALAQSRNVPAAQALYLAGGETATIKYLDENFGLNIKKTYPNHAFGWTVALGTPPLRPSDIANGYVTLATKEHKELCPIVKMETLLGEEVDLPCETEASAYLTEEVGFYIADALSDPKWKPQYYWGPTKMDNYPGIAVKTGTSNKRVGNTLLPADNWIAGFTPKMTSVMWAGNTDGRALYAGSFAAEGLGDHFSSIWDIVLADYPNHYETFERPDSVKRYGQYWVKDNVKNEVPVIPGMKVVGKSSFANKPKPKAAAPAAEAPKESGFTIPKIITPALDVKSSIREKYLGQ